MNVRLALDVFSPELQSAIKTFVHDGLLTERALTTCKFLNSVFQWYSIMNNHQSFRAFKRDNPEFNTQLIDQLSETMELFAGLEFVIPGDTRVGNLGWKPIQTGLLLGTHSMIKIASDRLDAGYSYFLTGRINQDCLENHFSIIRMQAGPYPTAVQAANAERLVLASTYYSHKYNKNFFSPSGSLFEICRKRPPIVVPSNTALQCPFGGQPINDQW